LTVLVMSLLIRICNETLQSGSWLASGATQDHSHHRLFHIGT